MKLTNQRAIILSFMSKMRGHPTVEEVYEHVRKRLPRISKKTVYSNLEVLAGEGFVREVNIAGVRRYESATPSHHHLICGDCKEIFDIELPGLAERAMEAASRIKGFTVLESHVHYYGTCGKCEKKKGGRK